MNEQGYGTEDDPLVTMKGQELQAEHEFVQEQQFHGRHGLGQLLHPATDLIRVALIWAMQARQLYIQNLPSHRNGDIFWQQGLRLLGQRGILRMAAEAVSISLSMHWFVLRRSKIEVVSKGDAGRGKDG